MQIEGVKHFHAYPVLFFAAFHLTLLVTMITELILSLCLTATFFIGYRMVLEKWWVSTNVRRISKAGTLVNKVGFGISNFENWVTAFCKPSESLIGKNHQKTTGHREPKGAEKNLVLRFLDYGILRSAFLIAVLASRRVLDFSLYVRFSSADARISTLPFQMCIA